MLVREAGHSKPHLIVSMLPPTNSLKKTLTHLVLSIVELQLAGLAGAVGARQRAGAVGRPAAHLVHVEQARACTQKRWGSTSMRM